MKPLRNAAFTEAQPLLSVLIPFYRESPLELLGALRTRNPERVEIILIDDGSDRPDITSAVSAFIEQSPLACELITLTQNEGRARGRSAFDVRLDPWITHEYPRPCPSAAFSV